MEATCATEEWVTFQNNDCLRYFTFILLVNLEASTSVH